MPVCHGRSIGFYYCDAGPKAPTQSSPAAGTDELAVAFKLGSGDRLAGQLRQKLCPGGLSRSLVPAPVCAGAGFHSPTATFEKAKNRLLTPSFPTMLVSLLADRDHANLS